jgi:transposase-like protein
MVAVEREHGNRPIDLLVIEALTNQGTIDRAAASLGVNAKTLYGWMIRLRIQTRKVAFTIDPTAA